MTYTLSFTVKFPHDDDMVYLALCYPYTYTDLQDYLTELASHPVKSTFSTVRLLCKSLAGNNVYYVTVTSPPVPGENKVTLLLHLTVRKVLITLNTKFVIPLHCRTHFCISHFYMDKNVPT